MTAESIKCIFCDIAAGRVPSAKVFADGDRYAFRDINPQAPTHILLIPRQHVEGVDAAGVEHQALLGELLLVAASIARAEGLDRNGYRLVINQGRHGGQTVGHLHVHILGGRQMNWPPG